MKKQQLTFMMLLCLICTQLTYAQTERNCHTMDNLELLQEAYPESMSNMEAIENHTRAFLDTPEEERSGAVITIPTVVHVIYANNTQNISEAQILSQMQVLNDDFRRLNSDANNTWSQAADTEIEFCLASIDPDGNPTNGITRTSTSVSSFGTNDEMKFNSSGGKDAWPASEYLNMWVCNIGGGILGYAQFPGSGSAATDGVVMGYNYFGTIGTAQAPFDGGRTTTHEVGHWLNLRHIWGDGNCNADDFVSDTPASDAANYGCATGHVSCNSTDMVQNYMDYSDDACMNLFTAGQKARMQALFAAGGARASLLNSNACGSLAPSCNDGIQNQDETGIDCGGATCPACPTCNDGIQNGDEFGVDCGGSNCPTCPGSPCLVSNTGPYTDFGAAPTACGAANATTMTFQAWTNESYIITDLVAGVEYNFNICSSYNEAIWAAGITVATADANNAADQVVAYADGCSVDFTATTAGTYIFIINDLNDACDATTVQTDNGFPSFYCYETATPTCTDGIQNGSETGVDCGGPDCPACVVDPCTALNTASFYGFDAPAACGIANATNTPYQAWSNEAFFIDSLITDTDYNFNFCNGYDAGLWSASITIYTAVTDPATGNVSLGQQVAFAEGCSVDFMTTSTDTDYIAIVNDVADACDAASQQLDNGFYQLSCLETATCTDGVQNGSETGVDCGGPDCAACPTCTDGVQNGSETGVDCGGPDCPACPTCTDGVQNGSETGVDCGGPDCAACPTTCDEPINLTEVFEPNGCFTLRLTWDAVPAATAYELAGRRAGGTLRFWTVTDNFRDFTGLVDGRTYQWSVRALCGSDVSTYQLIVDNQFVFASTCTGARTAGLADPFDAFAVELFPNPTEDNLTINMIAADEQTATDVVIYDLMGREVVRQTTAAATQINLNVSNLNSGCYMVQVSNGSNISTQKLVIR